MANESLALERAFPALCGKLPHVELACLPTRVHRLANLEADLGAKSLWIKRDDESCRLYGGNKPRKLEFILGDAIARGKRTVLTNGGIGTNHGLATTICARALGLKTILLLLQQPLTAAVRNNLRRDLAAGAEMHYAPSVAGLIARGLCVAGSALLHNELPYIIPTGGTSRIGVLGYVNAAFELREQISTGALPEPDYIFVPIGSGGTLAGLVLGAKLAGLHTAVVGVMVTDVLAPSPWRLARLANKTMHLLRQRAPELPPVRLAAADFAIIHGYLGTAYGAPTAAGKDAQERMQRREGIQLDTTYSAKCLAAMIDAVRAAPYHDAHVLFWNTYSSVDVDQQLGPLPDYRQLPQPFHQFFTGPLPA